MKYETERDYLLRQWRTLSDESKRVLAASPEERAFVLVLWRAQYQAWCYGRSDDLAEDDE